MASAAALASSVPQAVKNVFANTARRTGNTATGIVISAGLAEKTAKVRIGGETWNNKVKKYFKKPEQHLVHDPNNSLRTGDVVEIVSGWRTSKRKRFVVNRIVAPFGPPIDERPPVPTQEEREATHALQTKRKKERKHLRDQAERLAKKLQHAEKVTGQITKMAQAMKLVRDVEWKATPVRSK